MSRIARQAGRRHGEEAAARLAAGCAHPGSASGSAAPWSSGPSRRWRWLASMSIRCAYPRVDLAVPAPLRAIPRLFCHASRLAQRKRESIMAWVEIVTVASTAAVHRLLLDRGCGARQAWRGRSGHQRPSGLRALFPRPPEHARAAGRVPAGHSGCSRCAWIPSGRQASGSSTWAAACSISSATSRDPKSRGLGFAMSALPTLVMLLGVLLAAVRSLFG